MYNHNHIDPTCCPDHKPQHLHGHPHQCFHHDLMRPFDPNDPANKNRTFAKMVESANRKHLNPGELSFHYYIDVDGKVHGFMAIGNISDKLPHIIISDTGSNESAYQLLNNIQKLLDEILIDKSAELQEFKDDVTAKLNEQIANILTLITELDPESVKEQLTNFSKLILEFDTKLTDYDAVIAGLDQLIDGKIEASVKENVDEIVNDKVDEVLNEKAEALLKIQDIHTATWDWIAELDNKVETDKSGLEQLILDNMLILEDADDILSKIVIDDEQPNKPEIPDNVDTSANKPDDTVDTSTELPENPDNKEPDNVDTSTNNPPVTDTSTNPGDSGHLEFEWGIGKP